MLSIFFHDTATTEIYTLSLHDALPILFFIVIVGLTRYVSIGSILGVFLFPIFMYIRHDSLGVWTSVRSEEHTSELQSRQYIVCRILLERKYSVCSIFIEYCTSISFSFL